MKKADLVIGQEYAISGDMKIVPKGGLAAMDSRGYGQDTFPMGAVRRIRLEEIDVPVEVPLGVRSGGTGTETKKMIRVTWLDTGIDVLERFVKGHPPTRLGSFVFYKDSRFIKHAKNILGPWAEYTAEYDKRLLARVQEDEKNNAAEQMRERVLLELSERGISAREGGGFSYIEIEASELERLLGMVAFDASNAVIHDIRGDGMEPFEARS